MSTSGKPFTEKALRAFLKHALKRGYYRESFHAEHEHPERAISTDDVIHGLKREGWTFAKLPNYDTAHKNWEYLIRTHDLDGAELHIKIAVFPGESRFEVITRW